MTLMHGGVNAAGQEESGTVTLQADGKEHPVEQSRGVVAVTKWGGPRLLETVAGNDGTTVGEQSYELSADGRTLTAKVWGTDAGEGAWPSTWPGGWPTANRDWSSTSTPEPRLPRAAETPLGSVLMSVRP